MNNLYFENIEELVADAVQSLENLSNEDNDDIGIIAKYEHATEILREIMCYGYQVDSIELYNPEYENYDREYLISVYESGIICEPLYHADNKSHKEGYYDVDAGIIYLLDDCNSSIIPHLHSSEVYEVGITEDYDDCDCESCEYYDTDFCDMNTPGDTSREVYKLNGKIVDKNTYETARKEFFKDYDELVNEYNKKIARLNEIENEIDKIIAYSFRI